MKTRSQLCKMYLFSFLLIATFTNLSVAFADAKVNPVPISFVDTSLSRAQKYVLRVDGKPFYMTSIQVRLDKLRYYWDWDANARDAIIAQAASDGFNTVSIPIHWYEVEPKKNDFNWEILDEYLGLAKKHGLKMELLWFGQNSGGHVQWLGANSKPVHLRTPDYVLYAPSPSSSLTTSNYKIRRDLSAFTLDLNDPNLMARETYVLGKVMRHIAIWDKVNGSPHTVIGVQVGNEVTGINGGGFPASLIISYLSNVASAVKRSAYVVWTRLNCVNGETESRINANDLQRSTSGTNIDFVGIDLYGISPSNVRTRLPYRRGNYRMIMESGAEVSNAAQFQLAALSGNNAYDYYDMCGPDGYALYDRTENNGFRPHGAYVNDVRVVNRLLNSDLADIALKSQGYGLFVHNWAGDSDESDLGVEGISFLPATHKSQAISISRSNTEIVLMNTNGGLFTYPESLNINGASKGHFDSEDRWINEGNVPYSKTSISPPPGTTIRLTRPDTRILSGISR
jgi:hypothetical protein